MRSHKKRHSVNRERSREESAKARKTKLRQDARDARARAIKRAVSAFFRGEADTRPSLSWMASQ